MNPSFVSSGRHSSDAPTTSPHLVSDCSAYAKRLVESYYKDIVTDDPKKKVKHGWEHTPLLHTPEGCAELKKALKRWASLSGFAAKNGYKIDWEFDVTAERIIVKATHHLPHP